MDWLEQELKSALKRQDPPPDFAARVAARARGRATPQWHRWLAAAAAVVFLAGAGLGYREYRGNAAKDQVMQAFKITAAKVSRIQTQIQGVAR